MIVLPEQSTTNRELDRMFALEPFDVHLAAMEWLHDAREQRKRLATLLRETRNAVRFIAGVRHDAVFYDFRRTMLQRNREEVGELPRLRFDALMDAAHAIAAANSITRQDEFFSRNHNLACGLQDYHYERFAIGRRVATLYVAAAMLCKE